MSEYVNGAGAAAGTVTPMLNERVVPQTNDTRAALPPELLGNRARLYTKLVGVLEDVKYIQRDKKNSFHGYTYASEAAIKGVLHEAFATWGLILLPPEILEMTDGEREGKNGEKDGKGQFLTTIKVRFGIADAETGEAIYGTMYGRGQDNMDKGIYKALTGALKYFLTTTFLIPTGDDPEAETKSEPKDKPESPVPARRRAPTPAQAAIAERKIASGDASLAYPWKSMGEMKRAHLQVREAVAETVYLDELARWGYRSFEELTAAIDHKRPNARDHAVSIFTTLSTQQKQVA